MEKPIDLEVFTNLPTSILHWIKGEDITLKRWQLERLVKSLVAQGNKIEALWLIRCAYNCNLEEAQSILHCIHKE